MNEETKETITPEDIKVAEAAVANGEVIAAKDIPTPEEQAAKNKANREAVLAAFKSHWLKRYGLEGIDLEKELELINKKQSNLSRSKRDAVQQFFMLFPVAQEVVNIENKKEDEDVKEL